MADGLLVPTIPSSFLYQDLVVHVELIQNQVIKIENILTNRWKNEKRKRDELKSRSLIFIDPYGNRIVNKYMDHQLINNITRRYKKDYVPKYLQQWSKIGTMNENIISSLNDCQLLSTVSKYATNYHFITYGEIDVKISSVEECWTQKFTLPILLMDNMEQIKSRLITYLQFYNMEWKFYKIIEGTKRSEKDVDEGVPLKSEDTIMSCQLYQDNCILLAKIIAKDKNNTNSDDIFPVFVKTITGNIPTFKVYSSMKISVLKKLIQEEKGIPPDQQRLIFANIVLEDEQSFGECNIRKNSTIHLCLRLRGGMYHFTSGRQDLNMLSYKGIEAVQNILALKIDNIHHLPFLSSIELQNFVLQAQDVLSNLYNATKEVLIPPDLPNLKDVLLPLASDNKDNNNSNDNV